MQYAIDNTHSQNTDIYYSSSGRAEVQRTAGTEVGRKTRKCWTYLVVCCNCRLGILRCDFLCKPHPLFIHTQTSRGVVSVKMLPMSCFRWIPALFALLTQTLVRDDSNQTLMVQLWWVWPAEFLQHRLSLVNKTYININNNINNTMNKMNIKHWKWNQRIKIYFAQVDLQARLRLKWTLNNLPSGSMECCVCKWVF